MDNEEKKGELPKVFLNQGKISDWFRPLKKGWHRNSFAWMESAYTRPSKFIGLEKVDIETRKYRIIGSAAEYQADIAILDRDGFGKNGDYRNPREFARQRAEQMFLFNGGIQIYTKGVQICGDNERIEEEFEGYTLERKDDIWIATKEKTTLSNLIVSPDTSEQERVERIEAIIRGYEAQDKAQRRAESSARHESFLRGQESGEVNALGYGL